MTGLNPKEQPCGMALCSQVSFFLLQTDVQHHGKDAIGRLVSLRFPVEVQITPSALPAFSCCAFLFTGDLICWSFANSNRAAANRDTAATPSTAQHRAKQKRPSQSGHCQKESHRRQLKLQFVAFSSSSSHRTHPTPLLQPRDDCAKQHSFARTGTII